jgi:NADH pyrophosphatase zinc ribbon domain
MCLSSACARWPTHLVSPNCQVTLCSWFAQHRTTRARPCHCCQTVRSSLRVFKIAQTLNPAVFLAPQITMREVRSLLPLLDAPELAVAGQAVALCQWHEGHRFCGRCGGATVPTEAGAKRECTRDPRHRLYPRTDPVVCRSPRDKDPVLGCQIGTKCPIMHTNWDQVCSIGFTNVYWREKRVWSTHLGCPCRPRTRAGACVCACVRACCSP